MPKEIERKFRVRADGWTSHVVSRQQLRQGYLSVAGGVSVRVRVADHARAWITVKGGGEALHRDEFEYAVPPADGEAMLALCRGIIIAKERHLLDYTGAEWVVDVFSGAHAGLVLCEIEFKQGLHEPELPDWIGEDVTGNPEYYNSTLAALPPS